MAFCIKGKGFCVGCSFRTIEKKQFNVATNSKCFQWTLRTLQSSRCSRELCYDCVTELLKNLQPKQHLFHEDCNNFIQGLHTYHNSKGTVTPQGFIGHCCLIDVHYPSKKERAQVDQDKVGTLFFQQKHLPTALIHEWFEEEHVMAENVPHLGGCMCLPEYKLLLPSNESSMDILGLGREGDALQAKWHYVIDERLAAKMRMDKVKPSTVMPDNWTRIDVGIKVPLPHALTESNKKFVSKYTVLSFQIWIRCCTLSHVICYRKGLKLEFTMSPSFVMRTFPLKEVITSQKKMYLHPSYVTMRMYQ